MLFKNLKIYKKLYFTLTFVVIGFFISGEWLLWQSSKINKNVSNIYTQEIVSLENISNVKGALYRIRDRVLRLTDAKTSQEIQHHKIVIQNQLKRIKKEFDFYENTRLSPQEEEQLYRFQTNLKEYLHIIYNDVYTVINQEGKETTINKVLYNTALFEFRETREALSQLSLYQIHRAQKRLHKAEDIFNQQMIIVQICILFILFFSIFLTKKLINSILSPIKKINYVLHQFAKSNFKHRVNFSSEDEFGEMTKLLNDNLSLLESTFDKLNILAHYDVLTKLPNRRVFEEKLQTLKGQFCIMFIDVDNFKAINDTYGHDIGDEVLIAIAKRMQSHLRENDILVRLGGDEFAILISDLNTNATPGNIANKIIDTIAQPFYIKEHSLFSSVSIGIYIAEDTQALDNSTMMSYADLAMYKAKKAGRAQYVYFDKQMQESEQYQIDLEHDLKSALKNNEFEVFYQPIVNAKVETLYSLEALIRWRKNNTLVLPQEFLSTIESNGMIIDITYLIIEDVCQMVEELSFNENISVNLSILQFHDANFIPFLKEILIKHPSVNANQISFEITENFFSKNSDYILSKMHLITSLGFKFSLDDFAAGHSPLACLQNYPISTLKIDKSFVKELYACEKKQNFFDAIILLATTLDIKVIVKGVEDRNTLGIVTKDTEVKIQGFYYYKPMSRKTLIEMF